MRGEIVIYCHFARPILRLGDFIMQTKRMALCAGLFLSVCFAIYPDRSSSQAAGAKALNKQTTFSKDVAPILKRQCVACHMPNWMAPMSLMTYKDARHWA